MRKLALGLGMVLMCLCCNSANAAVSNTDSMNSRIKSLQERLKQFQNRTYTDEEERMVVAEEAVDLILDRADESILPVAEVPMSGELAEKIVEDLENRSDVAMTVLFHDDSEGLFGASKEFAMIDPPKVIIEGSSDDNEFVEPQNRQEFYANLRQKVLLATRSNKLDADELGQQLASLQ